MRHTLTLEEIEILFKKHGYRFFTRGNFNLNLFGIRNRNPRAGEFDDTFYCVYKKNDKWIIHDWSCTTDPGLHWLKNPMKAVGCASLAPGQYRGMWGLGMHRGIYQALVQRKPCKVFRDNNKDDIIDYIVKSIQSGRFGINGHRTKEVIINDKSSAGCQVLEFVNDFELLMQIVRIAVDKFSNSLTYTLFESKEVCKILC